MIRRFFCAAMLLAAAPAVAQTDSSANLLDELGTDGPKHPQVIATFKATRLVNGATVEQVGHGVLDFRILHRFNTLNNGLYDLFGLDGAVTKLAFDYGVTDWLMVGFGRSTLDKEYDGSVRAKLLRQTEDNHMPVSVSYSGAIGVVSQHADVPEGMEYYFSNRLAFTNQILIARKFSERLSLQLAPSVVHYNLVPTANDPNTIYALGLGGRVKLSRRFSLNAEWYPVLGDRLSGTTDVLALGVDIETGGHVFQLHFTNSTGMTERTFIGQTTGTWGNGDIRFGFNISRVFTIVKPKAFRQARN